MNERCIECIKTREPDCVNCKPKPIKFPEKFDDEFCRNSCPRRATCHFEGCILDEEH